ncbi:MAG TPA: hypothetical protein ENK19_02110, partial [Acidobacteria bacterium]|nr:hypothetical protein [Acidobacteriota bacterium]
MRTPCSPPRPSLDQPPWHWAERTSIVTVAAGMTRVPHSATTPFSVRGRCEVPRVKGRGLRAAGKAGNRRTGDPGSGRGGRFGLPSFVMSRRRTWLLFLLVVALRVVTQGWDSGLLTPHPDERQVAYVAEKATGWFGDPGFYAYGSLHFRLVRAVTAVEGLPRRYAGLLRGGRTLSLAASVLAILLGFVLARRAWGERTAALALVLAAFVPLDLQQSHYATVEAHHALWVAAALAALWWLARSAGWPAALGAGAAAGASLAVKVSSLGLVLPVAVALLIAARRRGALRAAALGAGLLAAALAAFWLGQPWAFRGGRPPLLALAGLLAATGLLIVARRTGTWTR